MTALPQAQANGPRDAFTFGALSTSGLLWLINRAVFHPRGLAMAIEYAEGDPEPRGWSLHAAAAGEPFTFDLPAGVENNLYAAAEELIAATKLAGRTPLQAPSDSE